MAKIEEAAKPKVERRRSVKAKAVQSQPISDMTPVSESDIARRAFEVYCARGNQPGSALDDWLQAERELTATSSSQ